MDTQVIEFGDREGIRRAAQLVAGGEVIGVYVDGVDTLWVDGRLPHAAQKIQEIKGEGRAGKPLSAIVQADVLVPLIDLDHIPQPLRPIFSSAPELEARLGAVGPLRLPVRAGAVQDLPPYMYTQSPDGIYWLQDFVPKGHPTTILLLRELMLAGVTLPAATSMNISGTPEIADQVEALEFSRSHDVPLLIHDPHPNPLIQGSFPILGIGPDGVSLLREGHYPGQVFAYLLEYDIDLSAAKPAKYPISEQINERYAETQLRGPALHKALLQTIHG